MVNPPRGLISYRTPWSYIRETIDYADDYLGDRIIAAGSEITSPERALKAINAGADALLTGTSIMTDPGDS
ncbi:MAG: hypothetical protein GSR86_04065 [Desulfurococcales archaeon]|nr:hypothetical protein [Desulfurococcales archaeon]